MKCQKCGTELKPNVKFCPGCGEKIDISAAEQDNIIDGNVCKKCGSVLKPDAKLCPVCGENIADETKSSETANEPAKETVIEETKTDEPAKETVIEETKTDEPAKEISADETKLAENSSETSEQSLSCKKCGAAIKPNAKFCPVCGEKAASIQAAPVLLKKNKDEEKKSETIPDIPIASDTPNVQSVPNIPNNSCLKCGNILKPNAKFCPVCGAKVGENSNANPPQVPIPAPINPPIPNQIPNQIPNPIPNQVPNQIPNPMPNQMPNQMPNGANTAVMVRKPIDKKKAGIIAGIAAAAIIVLIIIVVIVNRTPSIDLNSYISVKYSGYNSYGSAMATFDSDKFLADWKGKLKFNSVDNKELMSYLIDEDDDPAESILSAVKYSYYLTPSSNLSNDDQIKLTWDIQTAKKVFETYIKCEINASDVEFKVSGLENLGTFDPFEKFSISYSGYNGKGTASYNSDYSLSYSLNKTSSLSNGDSIVVTVSAPGGRNLADYCAANMGAVPGVTSKTFKVEGLDEMGTFDPFDGIDVTFSGIAPKGKAEISNNTDKSLRYSLDKKDNLNNGDKVVVTVTAPYGYDLNEYCENNYEVTPSSTTKEFTVSGLPVYVTAIADIPEKTLNDMKAESEDQIKSNVTSEGESLTSLEYQGMLLLNLKDGKDLGYIWGKSSNQEHMYYLVYKVTVTVVDYDKKTKTYTYLTYCRFHNITKLEDGTCSIDISAVVKPDEKVSPKETVYAYYGYEKYDTLFAKVVTARLDNYKYETDIKNS